MWNPAFYLNFLIFQHFTKFESGVAVVLLPPTMPCRLIQNSQEETKVRQSCFQQAMCEVQLAEHEGVVITVTQSSVSAFE